MTEYRASFDAVINFSNGGDLTVHGFRVDVPGPGTGQAEIAALFVASLGLLMTDTAELSNVEVFAEPHKGTRGGPSDHPAGQAAATGGRFIELGHVIRGDMITYPGPPGPQITPPRDGADLGAILLARTVDLPAVVVRVVGARQHGVTVGALAAHDVRGKAVLLHTGDDARFGTPAHAAETHFLTRAGAAWLTDHGAALVGIDGLNIDDTADGERPAHTLLLAAGIPIVEQLTGLDQLPPTGAWFSAVPLRIEGLCTIPVRAFARLPE